jgi:hypothetical protein
MGHSVTLPRIELEELEKKAAAFDRLIDNIDVRIFNSPAKMDITANWVVTLDRDEIVRILKDNTIRKHVEYDPATSDFMIKTATRYPKHPPIGDIMLKLSEA